MRRVLVGIVCASLALVGAASGPASAAGETAKSGKCTQPPLTMHLEAGGSPPVGSATFRVTDGVARRVAILPKAKADITDTKARARLERQAGKTRLALYAVYLADFAIPREQLAGFSFGDIRPAADGTIATLSIVPPTRRGFSRGDVVTGRDLAYDTTTTFAPVGLTVRSAGNASASLAYTDVVGQVKIVELDAKRICLAVDLELRNGDRTVTTAKGTVAVPVVRAANSFYFT